MKSDPVVRWASAIVIALVGITGGFLLREYGWLEGAAFFSGVWLVCRLINGHFERKIQRSPWDA